MHMYMVSMEGTPDTYVYTVAEVTDGNVVAQADYTLAELRERYGASVANNNAALGMALARAEELLEG